ncbi:MAG: helicase-exonuclease AddAB subunit AddA [Clostridiaceae bacterium]|nr:helicase-exonuclease AddAB subunit AddA [Clostridiaceae bacterium]
MSETRWTNEQWDAITAKDCNLLVAAAAGAGKTAVLVERIIKKITDEKNPVDVDRLLVVTFTNAAAAEMRERIANAISKYLENNPGSTGIQRQMALLGKASITTIHSFCTEVIRSNFHLLNIDPDFRIADETESYLMKLEALNEIFEEQYEKEDNQDFYELLESYGGNRDDQQLMDIVLDLHTFIQSSPWPEKWLKDMTEALKVPESTDFASTLWGKILLSSVKIELKGMKDMLTRALDIIMTEPGLEKYLPVFQEDISNVNNLIVMIENGEKLHCGKVWDDLYFSLNTFTFSNLPRAGKEADETRKDTVKGIRDNVKKRLEKIKGQMVNAGSAELINEMNSLYARIKCLAGLVIELSVRYNEKKNRKSILDFNDLEHYCLEILTKKDQNGRLMPSDTALQYRERFDEIMVDEYQDSNLVQEFIINIISRVDSPKPNIFMVGDVKQSIYRFRQAKPELFMQKYNTYSTEKESPFRKILLYKNFRSRKNVVDTVNFIFKQIMSVNAGELDYTEEEALNPGAEFPESEQERLIFGGSTELHIINTGDSDSQLINVNNDMEENNSEAAEQEEEMLDNIQCEARMVVKRIRMLMEPDEEGNCFAVFDKNQKKYRKLEYRDIVILLRTTKNWSDVFVEELTMAGIPVFADTGSGFFKTVEIQVILSLLQVIDNPYQDIPLLSVLRSPIFSFTTDDLVDIRLAMRNGSLFDGLIKLSETGSGEVRNKAKRFLDSLAGWREASLYLPADQLIWKLYSDTGYYSMVGAMPGGDQRQANLRILFERAKQFEETSYKGLFNFINFIDKLKSSKGDMGSAKILGENDNVVRIMSIHKSKGLEFPVVFLSGCGKKFNLQDMNKSILLHQDMGFGPDVVDYKKRLSWPSAAKEAIKVKIKNETLSEEMRILYVALTRAREKLIITGSSADVEKALNKWFTVANTMNEKLSDYDTLNGRNYLDWIVPAVMRHSRCEDFRKIAASKNQFKGLLIEDSSLWDIKLWNKSDILQNKDSDQLQDSEIIDWMEDLTGENGEEPIAFDNKNIEEIDRRLGWEYKYLDAAYIPAKISVTELKRRFNAQSSEESASMPYFTVKLVKKPMFLEEKKGLSAAEKGTIIHFIMQHLDLDEIKMNIEANLKKIIDDQVKQMIIKDLITPKQAESVDVGMIERFFGSDLGRRMMAAKNISREIPFNIAIPFKELYHIGDKKYLEEETALLQGVIDCFFEEDDGVVLIDYKTDYVPEGKESIIKDRYKFQLDYYARALEQITGKKVKAKYIYLFQSGSFLIL